MQAVKAQAAAMQRGLLDGRGSADLLCTSMLDCPLDGRLVGADDQLDWDDQHIACSLEAMVLNQPDVRRRAGSESARRGVNDSARSSTLAS